MIDFKNLEKYRENNRIEAKKALGGFPQSVWETYSAFANTMGGIILLGVEEHSDYSLHAVDSADCGMLAGKFRSGVNDTSVVSVNVLSDKDITVETADGKRIVVINVPCAGRCDRPVYIGGNPFTGTYRRNGEGDYKCTAEEVKSMLRDAAVKTPDMRILENYDCGALDYESVKRYRANVRLHSPEFLRGCPDDITLLCKVGAAGCGKDGKYRPTAAGLLSFGKESDITGEFPYYFLDYRELGAGGAVTDRVYSGSGDWIGNLYDFYLKVHSKLSAAVACETPYEDVESALSEALANALVNADYYGKGGVSAVKNPGGIILSNPGRFRIQPEKAKTGGVSDPRNAAVIRIFGFAGVGNRSGSGIPKIFSVWKNRGWAPPSITEEFNPDRITVVLPFVSAEDNFGRDNSENTGGLPDLRDKTAIRKAAVVDYLTDRAGATAGELGRLLGVSAETAVKTAEELLLSGIVVSVTESGLTVYKLKR